MKESSSGGVGVLGLLGVAFVVLKLCHVIDWSWWWVTAPFWGLIVLIILFFLFGMGIGMFYLYVKSLIEKK